eukprot:gb/GFBE01055949.1/.p1 GENE.gb/GFBE01055949.1/~~gb/GFBE01055949.1/.p1  ORF type:complete len:230 (+),score=50.88 gb/GFBE01055949.1/:1-690(+)
MAVTKILGFAVALQAVCVSALNVHQGADLHTKAHSWRTWHPPSRTTKGLSMARRSATVTAPHAAPTAKAAAAEGSSEAKKVEPTNSAPHVALSEHKMNPDVVADQSDEIAKRALQAAHETSKDLTSLVTEASTKMEALTQAVNAARFGAQHGILAEGLMAKVDEASAAAATAMQELDKAHSEQEKTSAKTEAADWKAKVDDLEATYAETPVIAEALSRLDRRGLWAEAL